MRVGVEQREAGDGLGVIGILRSRCVRGPHGRPGTDPDGIHANTDKILITCSKGVRARGSFPWASFALLLKITPRGSARARTMQFAISSRAERMLLGRMLRSKPSPQSTSAGPRVYEHGFHVQVVAQNCCAAGQYELYVRGRRLRFMVERRGARHNCLWPEYEELRETGSDRLSAEGQTHC